MIVKDVSLYFQEHPGDYSITLFVSYEGYDGSTVTPKIYLSPSVEE